MRKNERVDEENVGWASMKERWKGGVEEGEIRGGGEGAESPVCELWIVTLKRKKTGILVMLLLMMMVMVMMV